MAVQSNKQEPVFDLIKNMSKAEKRNFKLYATRMSGNQEAKFVALFDCMDAIEEYDESRILSRCPVKKEQLPNMKAHLYRQILISIRLLDVQHSVPMQIREQIDFARILYDRGLYRQSMKLLEKAKEQALNFEEHTIAIDIIEFQKKIETMNGSRSMASNSVVSSRQAEQIFAKIETINDLTSISNQLYSLYLKLGYARTQKDLNLIIQVFGPKLRRYNEEDLSFTEKLYYYQSQAWYNYIRHDMLTCYKYTCQWIALFNSSPQMKELMYDLYIRGYSRLLDGLFLLRSYRRFVKRLEAFEVEFENFGKMNDNARTLALITIYINRMNRHFYEGIFSEGVKIIPEIANFIDSRNPELDIHQRMILHYKIACMYFGNADYRKCMEYLNKVISTRDPQIRRDLQCYARILNLISCYEAGIDYNIEYQARAVYVFLIKMNDMQQVQKDMMTFLKRINSMYDSALKTELKKLYEKLKPLEQHPYERRTFYYLDIISWLESKIKGTTVAEVIRQRFIAENK